MTRVVWLHLGFENASFLVRAVLNRDGLDAVFIIRQLDLVLFLGYASIMSIVNE